MTEQQKSTKNDPLAFRKFAPLSDVLAWTQRETGRSEKDCKTIIVNAIVDGVCALKAHQRNPNIDDVFEWACEDSAAFDSRSTDQRARALSPVLVDGFQFQWRENEILDGEITYIAAKIEFPPFEAHIKGRMVNLTTPGKGGGRPVEYEWVPFAQELIRQLARTDLANLDEARLRQVMIEWATMNLKPTKKGKAGEDIEPTTVTKRIAAVLKALGLRQEK